ncbi:hypothetical protein B7C51_20880 [Paenibacillus larvae subsp. pulvifaciens]|uniref:Hyaluronate lyase n=1 Tax=Paenibacillus larvae subsp. pulvifaciens TaxID=1477 RepID=A0A1V0UX96_9BACL|nr:polysaccharide lyase family 8 super-sandwich domain-containing protein [Paenibacillus larvae]ARF69767.1 hypothetical protein B7C51_20880 [Paenibacillus larvae subsp. pulvifaciens]
MKKLGISVLLILVIFSGSYQGKWTKAEPIPDNEKALLNWHVYLTGEKLGPQDTDLSALIGQKEEELQNKEGTGIWDTIVKGEANSYLWGKYQNWKTNSADITGTIQAIEKMAVLYNTQDSKYYHDAALKQDILYALEWFYSNMFNESVSKTYGNWWDWEIGAPQSYNNTLVLMKNVLTSDTVGKYLRAVDWFVPNPNYRLNGIKETGANLLDKCLVVTIRGLLENNTAKITLGTSSAGSAYNKVTSGDGFYEDGSFIQHNYVPYTGGYGEVLLSRTADLFELLEGTAFLSQLSGVDLIYDYIPVTYMPSLYGGASMDMTKGRGISREFTNDRLTGRNLLYEIYIISRQHSNINFRQTYTGFVKNAILSDTAFANYYEGLSIYKAQILKSLVADRSIEPLPDNRDQNVMMSAMSQMFHKKSDFAVGISMFSKKISAFEYGNGENKKGWYTGAGALYLYNGDQTQFSEDYWPTVDMMRLPGITTDHKEGTLTGWKNYANTKSWTGGVSDGKNGSASMYYSMSGVTGSSLEAKKSWFLLDDKIVALGAGINSKEARNTETIVDNRKLEKDGSNLVQVNGTPLLSGDSKTLSAVKWAHLGSPKHYGEIGYVFPEETTIQAEKDKRQGKWSDLRDGSSSSRVSNYFATFAIPHGTQPSGAAYSYILLPNKSAEETEKYANSPDITIIANTPKQQAVKDHSANLWIGNFHEKGRLGQVEAMKSGAIMVKNKDGGLELTFSDPMREQSQLVFTLHGYTGITVSDSNPAISISEDSSGQSVTFTINTAAKDGRSYYLKVNYMNSLSEL